MLDLKNKRIAVMGLGVSGLSALKMLHALQPKEIIAINSGDPKIWANADVTNLIPPSKCFSENDSKLKIELETIDLVILSPGIPRDHELLKPLLIKNIPISGELELAYRYLESVNKLKPIIGITGTNGKTTTTTFLGEMIANDHKKVFVGGNIGIPFCDYAYNVFKNPHNEVDYIILELSSFQLESINHFHVNIALFLNLYQNHGERYQAIEDYALAKFNITNRFTKDDTLIYPVNFKEVNNWAINQIGKKIKVDTENPKSDFDLSQFKLPGIHNRVNLNFILEVAKVIGLSSAAILNTIENFKGVHHRIEYVDNLIGLPHFIAYNDAKSTNWDATITAVKAMEDIPGKLFLIIGGKKRGHGDSILPYLDFLKTRVDKFFLIGEMAQEIESEIKDKVIYQRTENLEQTLEELRQIVGIDKGIILFSPGFPSFDQFANYVKRGEYFVKLLTNRS